MGFIAPSRVRIPPSPLTLRPEATPADKDREMPVSFSIADSSEGPRKVVIWVTGDLDAETDENHLSKLKIFSGVLEFPARVKCAILPWHAAIAAVEGRTTPVTTEKEDLSGAHDQ